MTSTSTPRLLLLLGEKRWLLGPPANDLADTRPEPGGRVDCEGNNLGCVWEDGSHSHGRWSHSNAT
jgi:hypothetical protein